jgi:hypothetical protein
MRSFHLAAALCALGLAGSASAQQAAPPSLFPIPLPGTTAPAAYPVSQTAATSSWYDNGSSPAGELVVPSDKHIQQAPPIVSPEGDWNSCTSGVGCASGCGPACCPGKYVYANGLVMTHLKNNGFVTSIDSGTGSPELFFCDPEYGNLWHGGFEIGTGCCFGGCCDRGFEVVYWGLYPAEGTITATGTLDSLIDFGDIDFGGGDGNAIFDGAAAHRVGFDQGFHSVEVNLIGNYGGPLGCGRVGCCGTGCGERWGFGWLAGFRYINFTEDWLFSADPTDTVFDGDADELNYEVDLQNNLIGFQMGAGFDYCLTNRFQTYIIGKVGIYGNDIQMQQRIYGASGNAVINNGPFVGEDYDISASDFDLAMSGQIDLGGRYAITENWSVDAGWRVLALSGVAITEDNVVQTNFQNVDGTNDIQTAGSLLLHGGYVGLTYAW